MFQQQFRVCHSVSHLSFRSSKKWSHTLGSCPPYPPKWVIPGLAKSKISKFKHKIHTPNGKIWLQKVHQHDPWVIIQLYSYFSPKKGFRSTRNPSKYARYPKHCHMTRHSQLFANKLHSTLE